MWKFGQRRRGGKPFNRYALTLWLRSPRGRRLLSLEEREIRRVLPDLFGRHLLQIGSWGRGDRLTAGNELAHCAVLGTVRDGAEKALIDPEQLPLPNRTADVVLLPHSLEFARSPHKVLREVDRVLTDRGTVLVLGCSPWSVWAWRIRLGLGYRAFPQGARFVSVGRLCDWLELFDFEVTLVRRFSVGFPWWTASDDSWLGGLQEAYLVVAKKRVLPLTPVARPLRATVRPILGGIAVPEARRSS